VNLLIVYYSREGSTRLIAQGLAAATGGTLRELVDSRKMEHGGMFRALRSTMVGRGTTLIDPDYSMEPDAQVVIMTPVWLGRPTPAVTTFVKNAALRGTRTFVIAVGGTTGNPGAIARLAKRLASRGALVIGHADVLGIYPRPQGRPPIGRRTGG